MDDSETEQDSLSTSSSSSVGFEITDIPARAKAAASTSKKSIWRFSDRENAKTSKNKISTKDFDLKKDEFSKWLLEEKKVLLSMLNEKQRKVLFKKFVSKWNKRKLPSSYYRETGNLWIATSPFSPSLKRSRFAVKPSILTSNGSTSVFNNTFSSTAKCEKASRMSTRSSKTSFLNNTFSSATTRGKYDSSPKMEARGSHTFLNDTFVSTLTRGKSIRSSKMSIRGPKTDLNNTFSSATMKRGKYGETSRMMTRGSRSALNTSISSTMTQSNKHANNKAMVLSVDDEYSPSLTRTRSSKFSALQSTRDLGPTSDDLISMSTSPCGRATPARPQFGTFGKKAGARMLNELRAREMKSVFSDEGVTRKQTGDQSVPIYVDDIGATEAGTHLPPSSYSHRPPVRVKSTFRESSTVI